MTTRTIPLLVVLALISSAACRKSPSEQAAAQTPAGQAAKPAAQADAPPKPMPAELPEVLARVNGQPVTRADFERLVNNMEANGGPIPADQRDKVLRAALDRLIAYTVMKQEAAARNVPIPDTDVDTRVREMQGQMSKEQFDKALADRKTSAAQLRTDARVDMMIDKMLEGELATTTAATEAEAREFYDKNPDKFKQGEAVRASHILLMTNEKADDAAKKQARTKIEGLLERARSGEDFAALAKEHSQDGSAAQGGDLGFFQRGAMVPPFDEAAFSLKPGEISDVVTTQFGYHIIKVTERKGATTVPYEQVKPQIVEYLSNDKKRKRVDAFVEQAKKRAKIEVLV